MDWTSATKVDRGQVLVNDREQLIYLLTEAAEIEHGLMCSYLYAAWSLKQGREEGLTDAQRAAVDGWRTSIQSVAMEEMLHLALVNNLLISLGSPPHFSRPNFPVAPGYHPSSIIARLTPFDRDTADHFVYLERPEGVDLPRARGFEGGAEYRRYTGPPRLTPTAEEYDTVGHLYRGVEDGLRALARSLGERNLFLGDPRAQLDKDVLPLDGIIAVTGLDSALAAVSTIIEQGEGGRRDAEKSHYLRFRTIRDEYDRLLAQDPQFQPYRPAMSDPLMFRPLPGREGVQVTARTAAMVLDLANAAYGLMLRLLASGFGMYAGSRADRKTAIESAIGLMSILKSLGILLTTLPAGEGDTRAGMNFHLPRSTLALPQPHAARAVLAERAGEIAKALAALGEEAGGGVEELARRLLRIAQDLRGGQ
ncbi:MAG TPA: ferritin-like protein [Noviherbaspirillum sp.]|uniref:ferritin-like domain-containing protein n=1 Tax=Noviherbaspirillum sp. TaxID=1926288 RepID=UPI002D6EC798|nr:ferritin-like protein [Noviherbaspirillum sp.]HYD95217.1 ferritin-like protein [Noviherbaspirillum sp.]